MSSLTRYTNTTLAAAAIHQDITGASTRGQLREIYQQLPQGTGVIVQFYISTNESTSPGTRVHHAATALLENVTGRGLKITATIASYESGRYRTLETPLESLSTLSDHASTDKSSALIAGEEVSRASEETVVTRHPLMDASGMESLEYSLNTPQHRPLLVIAKAMQNIFAEGVPLPIQERFHYCTFSVMLSSGSLFYIHRGVGGGIADRTGRSDGKWEGLCYGVCEDKTYERQKLVATGAIVPYQLEREQDVRAINVSQAAARVPVKCLETPVKRLGAP